MQLMSQDAGDMSFGPLVHGTIGAFVHWTIGPMVRWFIGPLVECKLLNVNKIELLSERTSGVPPVIFFFSSVTLMQKSATEGLRSYSIF